MGWGEVGQEEGKQFSQPPPGPLLAKEGNSKVMSPEPIIEVIMDERTRLTAMVKAAG